MDAWGVDGDDHRAWSSLESQRPGVADPVVSALSTYVAAEEDELMAYRIQSKGESGAGFGGRPHHTYGGPPILAPAPHLVDVGRLSLGKVIGEGEVIAYE